MQLAHQSRSWGAGRPRIALPRQGIFSTGSRWFRPAGQASRGTPHDRFVSSAHDVRPCSSRLGRRGTSARLRPGWGLRQWRGRWARCCWRGPAASVSGQSSRRPSSRSARASAKCALDSRPGPRESFSAVERDLRLDDLVARQLVGQFAHAWRRGRPWRRATGPCPRSCRGPARRADRSAPPLPSPPKTASLGQHQRRRRWPRPPPSGRTARRILPARSADMRLVEQLVTIGPGLCRSTWSTAHGQRVLLAQVAPRCVDHRQPVGVGVLAEADVARLARHGRQHAGQVLGRRLGRVLELAVGLAAEHRRLAAELLQQPPAQQAARAVVRVQQHRKPAAADPLDVDGGQHGGRWCRVESSTLRTRPSRSWRTQSSVPVR